MMMIATLCCYDTILRALIVLLLGLSQFGDLPITHGLRSGSSSSSLSSRSISTWIGNRQPFLGRGGNNCGIASSPHPSFLCYPSNLFRQMEGPKYGALFRRMTKNDDPSNVAENRYLTTHSHSYRYATTTSLWNPLARIIMASLASVGAIETGYLTYIKMTQGSLGFQTLCSSTAEDSSNSCALALDSPYATIAGIPLTFYGLCAYSSVILLTLYPLLSTQQTVEQQKLASSNNSTDISHNNNNDLNNRITLLSVTTCMATFSIYLLSILLFVLHANCPFCILSAVLSISLGFISWLGGAADANNISNSNSNNKSAILVVPDPQSNVQPNTIPASSKRRSYVYVPPALFGLSSFVITTLATAVLYGTIYTGTLPPTALATSNSPTAVVPQQPQEVVVELAPPPISTISTQRALLLSTELQNLNARFFGAYWCSHCYEQKERLGKEAMNNIPYIECSREGKNSQADLCKARKIPGYPTWEIKSQLFPGERSIEELEGIVLLIKEQQPKVVLQ